MLILNELTMHSVVIRAHVINLLVGSTDGANELSMTLPMIYLIFGVILALCRGLEVLYICVN